MGASRCATRFRLPENIGSFADTAPLSAGGQILSTTISVSGKSTSSQTFPQLAVPDRFPARKTVPISLPVDAKGLEPWLGAIGHLLLIHEDAQTFVHAHPDESGTLTFLTRFPKPGTYRGWLQYQKSGEVQTVTLTCMQIRLAVALIPLLALAHDPLHAPSKPRLPRGHCRCEEGAGRGQTQDGVLLLHEAIVRFVRANQRHV
jgi:hypothetical protein